MTSSVEPIKEESEHLESTLVKTQRKLLSRRDLKTIESNESHVVSPKRKSTKEAKMNKNQASPLAGSDASLSLSLAQIQ